MRAMSDVPSRCVLWDRAPGLFLALLLLVACQRHVDDPAQASPSASAVPVDRLAPGELVPGDKKALWIVLPKDMKIDQALLDVVFASGPVDATDLANYVRARVRDGTVSIGATATVFDQVRPVEGPDHTLFIRIFSGPGGRGARMEVRNTTPRPIPEGGTPEERWKEFGLTPEGKLLDPHHLH
jgi:hypothetical protein